MLRNSLKLAIAGALLVASATAGAATTKTTTMTVSAAVAANCNVQAGNLSFGTYDASAVKTGSADVTVRCSKNTLYAVKLSAGGGSYGQRLLSDGTNTLQYNLFTESGLGTVWGDGTGSTKVVNGKGLGMSNSGAITHTVYGELPNSATNQDAPAGSYGDSITVTVEY